MCRLPLDLLSRIIGMVQVPLPVPGDPRVTWNHLRQQDLATLMRMTYFIAAPLLYKVVVVNNLASFFLGVDDNVRPHQEGCVDVRSTQTRICHSAKRKDGSDFQCSRHIKSPNAISQDLSDHGIFHKQQLLRFVEGVHFVYSSTDRHMYGNVRIEDYISEDGTVDLEILRHVDVSRYLNIPECIQSRRINPLPALRRLTIATWLGKCTNPVIESKLVRYKTPVSQRHRQFELYLASAIYRFPSAMVCHYPSNGFLAHYPPPSMSIFHNAIHEVDIASFGPRLRAGAENLVFVIDRYNNKTPLELCTEGYWMIARQLVDAGKTWAVGQSEFEDTKVIFVIERDMDQDYCEMTEEELDAGDEQMEDLREKFGAEMARIDPLSDFGSWMWDIEWVEPHLSCPVCEPELYNEIHGAFEDTSSSSSSCSIPTAENSFDREPDTSAEEISESQ